MPITNVRSRWDKGNLLYYDPAFRLRIVDAIGPGVIHTFKTLGNVVNPVTIDPTGWTTTVVEVGTGESEMNPSDDEDIVAEIITAANEDDGAQYQAPGAAFKCVDGVSFYLGMKFKINDVDQIDLLFGACITDTSLLGALSDGVYLESLDASTSVSGVTEKNGTETQTDSLGTLVDDTFQIWEMVWDGTNLVFYIDGVQVASHTDNIPNDEGLRMSIAFLTGEVAAQTMKIAWARGFAWT